MAGQIGGFGLTAALVSLAGMAVPFTYRTFVVEGQPWSVSFLADYLHFVIQAITILVPLAIAHTASTHQLHAEPLLLSAS